MTLNRRKFLKISGTFAIGAGILTLGDVTIGRGEEILKRYFPEEEKVSVRWAMVIDTRKFTSEEDFRKVIEACHRAHNVPHIPDPKRAVKWIWADTFAHTFPEQAENVASEELKQRKYLLLCNHCEYPACVRVCPVKATFKRPDGIVVQDLHRCIGCKFCMAACPYGSRSYNFFPPREYLKEINPYYPTRTAGVVEKCIFCYERLDEGKLPYCVEASEGKMVFGNLLDPKSEVRKLIEKNIVMVRKPELGTGPSVFYII